MARKDKHEEKKKKILQFLRRGDMMTSQISAMIGSNFGTTILLLEQLRTQGLIVKEKTSRGISWKIK